MQFATNIDLFDFYLKVFKILLSESDFELWRNDEKKSQS